MHLYWVTCLPETTVCDGWWTLWWVWADPGSESETESGPEPQPDCEPTSCSPEKTSGPWGGNTSGERNTPGVGSTTVWFKSSLWGCQVDNCDTTISFFTQRFHCHCNESLTLHHPCLFTLNQAAAIKNCSSVSLHTARRLCGTQRCVTAHGILLRSVWFLLHVT